MSCKLPMYTAQLWHAKLKLSVKSFQEFVNFIARRRVLFLRFVVDLPVTRPACHDVRHVSEYLFS